MCLFASRTPSRIGRRGEPKEVAAVHDVVAHAPFSSHATVFVQSVVALYRENVSGTSVADVPKDKPTHDATEFSG
jgi:hypothetical protein